MNPSRFLGGVGALVLLIGVANGASIQKRWIPERMSDNDYGYDNQQHQTTSDDGTGYQPNYMNYWSDYFPGGYTGGDYSGMMFRAGGQPPAPAQAMMDPVQQLQYVQAYSYAQQLQQQYPNGVPLPYRPQPSPYQPYQPGADATGRSGLHLLSGLLNTGAHSQSQQKLQKPVFLKQQASEFFMHPAFVAMTPSSSQTKQEFVLVPQEEPQEILLVQEPQLQEFEFLETESDTEDDGSILDVSVLSSEIQENMMSGTVQEVEVLDANNFEDLQEEQVLETVAAEKALIAAIAKFENKAHSQSTQNSPDTQSAIEAKIEEIEEQEKELKALQKIQEDLSTKEQHVKKSQKTKDAKKSSKSPLGRAQGGSGDYIDPNVYANYGGESGLVDSPLDLVYPGAMVPAQSYPAPPLYYPYAPPNPYSIPQQVYQPSAYSPVTPGPYSAPVMPYTGYPTVPSYYSAQPPLRYARNSASPLPMQYAVKYVYGAVPMNLPQSG